MVAAAIVGAAVVGGAVSTVASNKASSAQKDASRSANDLQLYQYDQTRQDQAPWRQIGQSALGKIGALYGINPDGSASANGPDYSGFYNSPDYQFALTQGTKTLDQSAASRGSLYSGAQMKGAQQYGQGLATQQFGNYKNGLASLAQIGQTANNNINAAGQTYANNAGNNLMYAGNANASSYINNANSFNNALNQGAMAYGYYANRPSTSG